MNFELRTTFTEEEQEILRTFDVSLDDWDYALITYDVQDFDQFADDGEEAEIVPKEYEVKRLLSGCCANIWYMIRWNNKPAIIGMAYHS